MKPPNLPKPPRMAGPGLQTGDRKGLCRPQSESALETRTTGSGNQPDEGSCRRCGGSIKGRRRNGYCSDRCRMQDYRDAERETLTQLFDDIQSLVAELRIAVIGN